MIDALIIQCAVPDAPPAIIREIIAVESLDDALAINVNKLVNPDIPKTKDIKTLTAYVELKISQGYSVDIGFMQINSMNLATYDLDVASVFDGCTNIATGSEIFMKAYRPAVAFFGKTEKAKQSALSAYNTGTFHRGFINGYVELYDEPLPAKAAKKEAVETAPSSILTDPKPNESDIRINVDFGSRARKAPE